MASIKQKSKEHLDRMIKGAAREAVASRKNEKKNLVAEEFAEVVENKEQETTAESSAKFVSREIVKVLREQLHKNGRSIQSIPINLIELGENIRQNYLEDGLRLLENSLKTDGLIQYPTLCLKEKESESIFVCKNGHRRIIAAKNLGWEKIDCIVLPFENVRNELYHMINANIREDVFYLDLAKAYEQAAELGESDHNIGERVGVNPRTVRWYRRLTQLSSACEQQVRAHPELFGATWAIKLARKGELPESLLLEANMAEMILMRKTWIEMRRTDQSERHGAAASDHHRVKAKSHLKRLFTGNNGPQNALWARNFLLQLVDAGYLPKKYMVSIGKNIIDESSEDKILATEIPRKEKGTRI